MAAAKTLSPAQLSARGKKAAEEKHARLRLIQEIAERLAGEPLSAKTTEELRALLAGAAVTR